MILGAMDKIELYYNGKYLGSCDYPHSYYEGGSKAWGGSGAPFYIGYCPFNNTGKDGGIFCKNGYEFFLKGLVYSIRLYTSSLSPEEIKLNYDMTLKYRDSFKND